MPSPPLDPRPSRRPGLVPAALALGLALAGCGDGPGAGSAAPVAQDVLRYGEALAMLEYDAAAAAEACRSVQRQSLRDDCLTAVAEDLADTDAEKGGSLCAGLAPGLARDECFFQVAERSRDVAWCAHAGAFADDCRLHRLSAELGRLVPRKASPGEFEADLALALPGFGLQPDDPRPWSAAYRWVLGGKRPLDRSACDGVADPERAEACRHTAIAVFQDLLNHARDTRTFPCDGSPLPERLQYVPDAELDAILATRRQADLCP